MKNRYTEFFGNFSFRWGARLGMLIMICQGWGLMAQAPLPPQDLVATAWERHIELTWTPVQDAAVNACQVFRSEDGGGSFTLLKTVVASAGGYTIDWTGDEGLALTRHYRLKSVRTNGQTSAYSNEVSATTALLNDESLMEMVQRATFRYFWDFAHPVSGLARERSNGNGNIVTTGGSGFGILAIVVGAERGWISREEAVNRMIQIASFLQYADRFHGAFPHWIDGTNGDAIPFSAFDNGADLVETAFLMQGLLTARQYFNQNTPLEGALRDVITGLWEDVEWDWFRRNNGPALYWHWSPDYEWAMNFPLRGFHEAQVVYLLAAASPTHGVPGSLYQSGWTSNPNYCSQAVYFGQPLYTGPPGGGPLFFAHYSYLGFDPRYWKDGCCNYFIRNRNHALIQWEYAKLNPENHAGYGGSCWGLTSSDGPWGYKAHDILPANDDGTVAPTAALSSMPYTPVQSLAALKYFYRELGADLWGTYGFYDAFNLDQNWYASSFLAIDQGPIVAMLENYRTGLLWDLFMQNQEIEPALQACGFEPDNTVGVNVVPDGNKKISVVPNPVQNDRLQLYLSLDAPSVLQAELVDMTGRVTPLVSGPVELFAGEQHLEFYVGNMPPGLYALRLRGAGDLLNSIRIVLP